METTRLSSKGQVIVFKSIREAYHWKTGQEFVVVNTYEGILLKPKQIFKLTKLEHIVDHPPYQGKSKTVEQMNDAIDSEIKKN